MSLTRRRALLGAGAVAAVGAGGVVGVGTGVLPGRATAYRTLHLDGPDGVVPTGEPGRQTSGSFVSRARGGLRTGWTVGYPPGADRTLPVVVVLHGRGNDHRSVFADSYLAMGRYLAAAVAQGTAPFALASVDGGTSYWHPRASGEDAGAMVVDELLPLLADRGLDTGRVGFLGWSMGGYGALRLAGLLGPSRVAGVAAMSPALFPSYASSAPGAFDDAADLADATVLGRQRTLRGIPVRIDCGEGDPFAAATDSYRDGFATTPAGGLERGDHDLGYWRRMVPTELRFLGRALA